MPGNEPTLNLTYDQLLETTRTVISTFKSSCSTPPDEFGRGLSIGAIDLFLTLIQQMPETERDYYDDHRQLRLLAGLETDAQEPAADVR
ncbi:MAG: hypothetical protein QRY16_19680 [Enterobacterales bacterium endosymbiont of Blomia tropicalis]|jgi:hypothetical protein|uniref:hypothetical protein n=1 Tax=Mixta mediterraneensis TaxID=2758443 RepID=UPI0025A82EE9|nr:hypothetical protein [Mixta mediterraneensis]MDL4915905.1 hypothetical protein [Mixta mediterraneensis]